MAIRKGKAGRAAEPTNYGGNILRDINLMSSSGETVRPAGTTDGTRLPTPAEQRARRVPYTADQIAADPYKAMMKNALSTMTYEQALANFRKLTNVTNMGQLAGTKRSMADIYANQKAYDSLTPEQKAAQEIFFGMGGSYSPSDPNSKYGGAGVGSVNTRLYEKYGLTAPTATYAPVGGVTKKVGNTVVTRLTNPLAANQRSALQRLRALNQSGTALTATQTARLNRLKAKKNAPTILP